MRRRLWLLGGQSIALGLAMAFLVVPASSVFLTEYGARALPYTYIGVAVAGVVVSSLMTRALRRLALSRVTALVLAAYTVLVTAGWIALAAADATWVTFPLIVMFPLAIPTGFVLVGTQAGRLLDVRQMKAHFPRVAAGFPVGFAVGGLVAARLVGPLGGPVPLLGLASLAAIGFLAVAVVTARSFPSELAVPPAPPVPATRSGAPGGSQAGAAAEPLRANRLVVLVFGYQVLSAVVTQLLDYMVWERASLRYPDPTDLARFLGLFGAVINVVSVAFVVLLAGRLLTRYGIGFGLAANPAGVLVLLRAQRCRRGRRRAGLHGALRAGVRPAGRRHHSDGRHHEDLDQRDVPGATRRRCAPAPRRGWRAWASRCRWASSACCCWWSTRAAWTSCSWSA